jgi:hypothetical protein
LTSGLPYELSLLAGFLSIFLLKRDPAARYTTAALAVLGLAVFPYTGWIIGKGTSTFQLWRLTWLTPLGIILAFLFKIAIEAGRSIAEKFSSFRIPKKAIERLSVLGLQAILLGGSLYITPWAKGNLKFGYTKPGTTSYYQDYIELSAYLEKLSADGAYIIGGPDRPTNDIIPSLSYAFQMISFRDERGGKAADLWSAMMGANTPPDERLRLYQQNQIAYIVIRDEPEWFFSWIAAYPSHFELLYQTKKLYLYHFISAP